MKSNEKRSLKTVFGFMSLLFVAPMIMGADGGCSSGGALPVGTEPATCGPQACDGKPRTEEAKVCADGTALGRTVCATGVDGSCFWDFPACSAVDGGSSTADATPTVDAPPGDAARADAGGACVPQDCEGQGATGEAKVCADGSAVGRTVCTRMANGQCKYDFPACPTPEAATVECTMADCAGQAADQSAKLCADGSAVGRTACQRNSQGRCTWDFPACPAAPAPDASDCACLTDMQWGADGGNAAYTEKSLVRSCTQYRHERSSARVAGNDLACTTQLVTCGSGLHSIRDIQQELDKSDVQAALSEANALVCDASLPACTKVVLFGIDPRPYDGTVFRIQVGQAVLEVGSPCNAQANCRAIPSGVNGLVDVLQSIDRQTLAQTPCSMVFKP